jgi:hypothetical protein
VPVLIDMPVKKPSWIWYQIYIVLGTGVAVALILIGHFNNPWGFGNIFIVFAIILLIGPIFVILIMAGVFHKFYYRMTIQQRSKSFIDDFQWIGAFKKADKDIVMIANKDGTKEVMTGLDFYKQFGDNIDAFMEARKIWRNQDNKWVKEFIDETQRIKANGTLK